jgi:hypothetical protein
VSNDILRGHWNQLEGTADPGTYYGQVILRGPAPQYAYLGPWSSAKPFVVT